MELLESLQSLRDQLDKHLYLLLTHWPNLTNIEKQQQCQMFLWSKITNLTRRQTYVGDLLYDTTLKLDSHSLCKLFFAISSITRILKSRDGIADMDLDLIETIICKARTTISFSATSQTDKSVRDTRDYKTWEEKRMDDAISNNDLIDIIGLTKFLMSMPPSTPHQNLIRKFLNHMFLMFNAASVFF